MKTRAEYFNDLLQSNPIPCAQLANFYLKANLEDIERFEQQVKERYEAELNE